MGMMFEPETIQYLFNEDTRRAARDVIDGRKKWNEVSPLVCVASAVIQRAENGHSDASWVIFKGSEEEALKARETLEDIGFCTYKYDWHDGADCPDGPGGHMSVDFSHMIHLD